MFGGIRIINFRGFTDKEFKFSPGLNIIYGKSRSGKTTIIDAFLFLQLFSYFYGSLYEAHPLLSDPTVLVHGDKKKFAITVKLLLSGKPVYYRLDGNTEKMIYKESFIFDDTVFTYDSGMLRIKDARKSKYTPYDPSIIKESIWDKLKTWKITLAGLPWKSFPHLVTVEASHWGGIVEAEKNVPEILARVLIGKIELPDKELRIKFFKKLKELFRLVFTTHHFLRKIVVLKYIDYKNAIGPSKYVSMLFDPYASNFPWIYLQLLRQGKGIIIRDGLRYLGIDDLTFMVGSTIDNRYYIYVKEKNKAIYSTRLATSTIKLLIYLSALAFSNGVVLIDDFDEHMDEDVSRKLLDYLARASRQLIITTRREINIDRENTSIIYL